MLRYIAIFFYILFVKFPRASCYLTLDNKVKRLINRHFLADKIRRSSSGFLSRARVRTLKMTITIIAVFIICWSPYYVMSVWWVTTIFQFLQNQFFSSPTRNYTCNSNVTFRKISEIARVDYADAKILTLMHVRSMFTVTDIARVNSTLLKERNIII